LPTPGALNCWKVGRYKAVPILDENNLCDDTINKNMLLG
jgi:hypothetical protein